MEGRFQRFGDRVNFLYLYTREAHPNPLFAPCGPTLDLGWKHASARTRSITERAQRARWLKDDFNLSFPYLIDTMDDAIKTTYCPSCFYTGWVIDCDSRVLLWAPWAWATPTTQWCGLNLADFNDFDAFLEGYLGHPSGCYTGPAAGPYRYVVPAAAHLDGANGTRWITDLELANPGPEDAQVTLTLRPRSDMDFGPAGVETAVPAGASRAMDDVLQTSFELQGAGALEITSSTPLVVASRTVNAGGEGTYGQMIRGLPARWAIGDLVPGRLLMLEESESFRTNLGLFNPGDTPVQVSIVVSGTDGLFLGALPLTVSPHTAVQENRFLHGMVDGDVEGVRADVRVVTPGGRVFAYATVVDNATGDSTFVPADPNDFKMDINIPVVANLPGANGTRWRSDLELFNPRERPLTVTLELWRRGEPQAEPLSSEIELESGRSLMLRDVLGSLAPGMDAATLHLHGTDGLMATSRTYNLTPDGTYGQLVPGMDVTGTGRVQPGEVGHLIQLEESAGDGRRTNLGLVNLRPMEVTVELAFFAAGGSPLGTMTEVLGPMESIQKNRVLSSFGAGDMAGARAEVRLMTTGGRILAFATSVDNLTGDSVFQPAWVER